MYDYLIVGSGLYGATFAYEANKKGKKCLVIDKRNHIGGNIYCENIENINVHKYGAHIFHTSNKEVWDYVNRFVEFNRYTNCPVANYKGELYNLPFNMNTFYQLWKVKTPKEAIAKIEEQVKEANIQEPKNLEEQAIKLVGKDIYEKLIKGYTEKQWGKKAIDLPSFIIKRLPVRLTFDNNYFNDTYQGIPIGGYNKIIEKMLDGIEVRLNTDFFENREEFEQISDKIVFTGMIDEFYDYKFGTLEYRSLRFEHKVLNEENYQGNAVVNYTEFDIPYTRVIEHKHFEYGTQPKTVITREYPATWNKGDEPYYPINDDKNNELYSKYKELADKEENVIFGGRLAEYKYYDMHHVIEQALNCVKRELPKVKTRLWFINMPLLLCLPGSLRR
ncbi:UDP-galactopyranose mutase [Romboutsia ilealis]|uniref:UDP-galactopyranose mutase n=1 Tax=Romboutsia ilealis TaxID=1115758 RepID=UPI00272A79FF|nr:UDP-galactopyranose mutase [Romboutsia ilealis]